MFSLSHWGMFFVPYTELESHRHFLWYLNRGPKYQLVD